MASNALLPRNRFHVSPVLLALLAAILIPLTGCKTVAGTGRSQMNFMSTDEEMSLGRDAYKTELADAKLITSGPQWEEVKAVCVRITNAADRMYPEATAEFEWEYKLVDDPDTINAWCLPGGKIAIYTGLLKAADTPDRLAAVVGHECAHAIARHGGERMSQNMAAQVILTGAAAGMSFAELSPAAQEGAMAAFGAGTQYGVLLPFSRTHESEADEIGLYVAAAAGYDPRQAVELWKNMAALGGEKPAEWMSTHPSDQTRIARLTELMPKAMKIYEENGGKP
jgi:predicted Zn-dependent protease